MMLKQTSQRFLKMRVWVRQIYVDLRAQYHRFRKLSYFLRDMLRVYRHMHWDSVSARSRYWVSSSGLLFQYHKLEKGLCIPGPKRAFGADPAASTIEILADWRRKGFSVADPIYKGALGTLNAYRERLYETPLTDRAGLVSAIDRELRQPNFDDADGGRPRAVITKQSEDLILTLESMARQRRSVRSFSSLAVPKELIERALRVAQLSPSACNRQPCKVHMFSQRQDIDDMLSFQNGNRGFGHTIPTLLVLTADMTCFFDASERNEPYIDGGLFAMALLYALHAQGVSSCCLNWCVAPGDDAAAHRRGAIPDSEAIVMYVAIGFAADGALSPVSPRRAVDSILIVH